MSDDKEALGHCVLCGKKSNGRVEDIAAEIVNRDILAGDVIQRNPDSTSGACFRCAQGIVSLHALACEWLLPGNSLSVMWRLGTLIERAYALPCEPASRELRGFEAICAHSTLSHLEREMDREEERQRTAARNAAILHDANHDCREGQR